MKNYLITSLVTFIGRKIWVVLKKSSTTKEERERDLIEIKEDLRYLATDAKHPIAQKIYLFILSLVEHSQNSKIKANLILAIACLMPIARELINGYNLADALRCLRKSIRNGRKAKVN